jgi:hypothetical protein
VRKTWQKKSPHRVHQLRVLRGHIRFPSPGAVVRSSRRSFQSELAQEVANKIEAQGR